MSTSASKFFIFISISIILQSTSFVILKLANDIGGVIHVILFMLAVSFVLARAFFWQKLLKITTLSKAYPFTLLTQVVIVFYSVVLFNEHLSTIKITGLLIILAGLLLIHKKA